MRRNWFIAAVVIGVVSIVVAAAVMRLTEDDPETTADWADAVSGSSSVRRITAAATTIETMPMTTAAMNQFLRTGRV